MIQKRLIAKTKIWQKYTNNLLFVSICIFILNLCIKSVFISSTPPSLTNDETYYATEALALLANGTDVTGTWRPWQLVPANPIYSELTGLTYAPGFLLFPHNTQLAIKVVPVLMGSLIPILLGLVMYYLFHRKLFFIVTAVIATVNPWIFQFSRMSFDSLASVFFYLLGIVGVLYLRGWKVLFALVPLVWGFFQYQGLKPLLLPLLALTIFYRIVTEETAEKPKDTFVFSFTAIKKITWKKDVPHLVLLLVILLLVVMYLVRLPQSSAGGRIQEFSISSSTTSQQVDTLRRLSFSNPFTPVVANKLTVTGQHMGQRFLSSFNLPWLFLQGNDNIDTFAVTQFGFLYIIDLLLIIYAVVLLWSQKRWRSQAFFLTTLIILGTLPNVLKNEQLWLTFRGSFMTLGLLLLSAAGLSFLLLQKKKVASILVIFTYALLSTTFFYHYFYSYPLLAAKDLFFYNRIIASYIDRQPQQRVILYGNKQLFDAVVAYNQLIEKRTMKDIIAAYQDRNYQLGNLSLREDCFDAEWLATQSGVLAIVHFGVSPCPSANAVFAATPAAALSKISLSSLIDSGSKFDIYNDTLCQQANLGSYIAIKENVLAVEKNSDQKFCESFFTKIVSKELITNKQNEN